MNLRKKFLEYALGNFGMIRPEQSSGAQSLNPWPIGALPLVIHALGGGRRNNLPDG